jgi:drug/metabolite transporter (DMT)-like permease
MATSMPRILDPDALANTGAVIVGTAAVLTAALVGVVALATGPPEGVVDRLPAYALVAAVGFVGALLVLEQSRHRGTEAVPAVAAGIGALAGLLAGLGTEGALYAVRNPDRVITSRLVVYLLAAALVAAGLGYWGLRHWRQVRSMATRDGL